MLKKLEGSKMKEMEKRQGRGKGKKKGGMGVRTEIDDMRKKKV